MLQLSKAIPLAAGLVAVSTAQAAPVGTHREPTSYCAYELGPNLIPEGINNHNQIAGTAIVGGIALAVSLGSRAYVANLIGAHHLRQAFGMGQRVRIGELEGTILEITAVSVVLETDQGRVTVPAKVYNETPIVLMAPKNGDG